MQNNKKQFKCEICRKKIAQMRNLVILVRTHTGKNPISVQFMSKRIFAQLQFESSHKNSLWRKTIQVQFMSQSILTGNSFELSHKNSFGRKAVQVQLMPQGVFNEASFGSS